jgi:tRNA dimethylallyltransferase
MFDVPAIPPGVREQLEAEADGAGGLEALYAEFAERDPQAAAKVSVRDRYRILRGLEILRASPGETLSSVKARFKVESTFDSRKIGLTLDRDLLRTRVQARTRAMLARGLVAEVEGLRAQGLKDWAPLHSVGYREVGDYLDGRLALSDLESQIVTSTMQLARKQMTWFKRDTSIEWFEATPEGVARARERGRRLLHEVERLA